MLKEETTIYTSTKFWIGLYGDGWITGFPSDYIGPSYGRRLETNGRLNTPPPPPNIPIWHLQNEELYLSHILQEDDEVWAVPEGTECI